MSVDYSTYLAYGRVITEKHEDVLAYLLNDFAEEDVQTINQFFFFGVDEKKFKEKYPLLNILSNVDQLSGSIPPALVVHIESSLLEINSKYGKYANELSPLRVNSQGIDGEGISQLKQFCSDYSLKEHLDWTIFTWIS